MIVELLLPLLFQGASLAPAGNLEASSEVAAQAAPAESGEDSGPAIVDEDDDIVVSGEAPKPEPVRCRYEKVIGSGIKKKICRTESQIKAEAAAAREGANAMARERQARTAGDWNETR